MKLDHFMTLSLSYANTVLWRSRCKIHRYVAAPSWQKFTYPYRIFGCSFEILHGGLIRKKILNFLAKEVIFFSSESFTFFVIKNLDPDPLHREKPGSGFTLYRDPKHYFFLFWMSSTLKKKNRNTVHHCYLYSWNTALKKKLFSLFQNMWKCKYIETSAKNNVNITELFEELLKLEKHRVLSLQPLEDTEKKRRFKEKCLLM